MNLPATSQALHEQCYAHVLAVLRYLVDPAAAGGAGERLQRSAQLSADDRAAFLKTLLQVCFAPGSTFQVCAVKGLDIEWTVLHP